MRSRTSLVIAVLAAAAGIGISFSTQQSAILGTTYSYAQLLGWGALAASAVLVIQGFWKAWADKRYMAQLRANAPGHEGGRVISELYTESRVYGWREMHIALSILVTVFAAIHGIFLLPSITYLFAGTMIGVAAFLVLLTLGLSGIFLESRRKVKAFGSIKKLHLWLMVAVLILAEVHALTAGSTIAPLGPTVSMWLLFGTVGLIGAGAEYAVLKNTRRFLKLEPIGSSGGTDLTRRRPLQKIGMLAAGTAVAVTFGGIATWAAEMLPSIKPPTPAQVQIQQPIVQSQTATNPQNPIPTGLKIGNIANIPVNSSIYFTDQQGNQDILVRLQNGSVVAYSSTCTHRPCTVGYDNSSSIIRCPCHGAAFDPSHGATVLQGPAQFPLPSVNVTVDSNGNIWAA
ncbi:MAG: Rieske (2Fe-2S) protein [Candidatus Bathyarchaeia archaeon]